MMNPLYEDAETGMSTPLAAALSEMLEGWIDDLGPAWREVFKDTELGFEHVDPQLELHAGEPIYPARKCSPHLGAPEGAHIFYMIYRCVSGHVNIEATSNSRLAASTRPVIRPAHELPQ